MSEAILWLDRVDQEAFLQVNGWLHGLARQEAEVATALRVANELGNGWMLALVLVGLVAFEDSAKRAVRRASEVAMAALSSGLLSYGLKKWIERPRPENALREAFAHGEAFRGYTDLVRGSSLPSGHTTTAFALAAVFAAWAGTIPVGWRRRFVQVAVFVLAALTGVARVYGGAHYPLDIVAGATLGTLCGWAVMRVSRRMLGPYASEG